MGVENLAALSATTPRTAIFSSKKAQEARWNATCCRACVVPRMDGQCICSKCGRSIRHSSYGAVRNATEAVSVVSSGQAQALESSIAIEFAVPPSPVMYALRYLPLSGKLLGIFLRGSHLGPPRPLRFRYSPRGSLQNRPTEDARNFRCCTLVMRSSIKLNLIFLQGFSTLTFAVTPCLERWLQEFAVHTHGLPDRNRRKICAQ